jgi:hypothetical protein
MDIRGVGTPISYSDENPIREWAQEFRHHRDAQKREPRDEAERKLLARWMGWRGRMELEQIVGSACYAYSHFIGDLDSEWRLILADHIRTEAGHGWGYIKQGDLIDPTVDHAGPDPAFEDEYGVTLNYPHLELMKHDFLSYLIAGNLWAYGTVTAHTIQNIVITTPKVLDFETRVVEAEEQGHHDAALQKLHDYVWQLIDRYGEAPIRKRIAEIDEAALNCGSRVIFHPPWRDFLQQYFDAPIENAARFFDWREYLYLNVLGFPPEPVRPKHWPREVPMPALVGASGR